MNNFSRFGRRAGVLLLVVFSIFTLTGCFDVSQVLVVKPQGEGGTMEVTLTTYNEEFFDSLKSSLTGEEFGVEDVEMEFNVVEPQVSDGEKKYQILMWGQIGEDVIKTFPYETGKAYEIKLVSEEEAIEDDLDEEDEGEEVDGEDELDGVDEEMARAMFRGYEYQVSITLPEPVVDGWWGKVDEEEAEKYYLGSDSISGRQVRISTPLMEAFTEHNHVTIITGPAGVGSTDGAKTGEEDVRETYEFGEKFAYSRLEKVGDDADRLESLFYLWKNDRIDYSGISSELNEMEDRAAVHLDDLARAEVPDEFLVQYRQANYIFSSWKMVVGMFREGFEDMDLEQLSAAYTAMDFLDQELEGL